MQSVQVGPWLAQSMYSMPNRLSTGPSLHRWLVWVTCEKTCEIQIRSSRVSQVKSMGRPVSKIAYSFLLVTASTARTLRCPFCHQPSPLDLIFANTCPYQLILLHYLFIMSMKYYYIIYLLSTINKKRPTSSTQNEQTMSAVVIKKLTWMPGANMCPACFMLELASTL